MGYKEQLSGHHWLIEAGNVALAVASGGGAVLQPYTTMEAGVLATVFVAGFVAVFVGSVTVAPWEVLWPTVRRYGVALLIACIAITGVIMVEGEVNPNAYAQANPWFTVVMALAGMAVWGGILLAAGGGLRSIFGLQQSPDVPGPGDLE